MKPWVKRALRTFGQTAIGYIAVNAAMINWAEEWALLKSALIGLGVSAVAAGIAAAMNILDEKK